MITPIDEKLNCEKIIAEKDGYQLLEKHAVIYLHNWVVANGSVNFERQVKCLLLSLKRDFDLSPEQTIWQLENAAKENLSQLNGSLKRLSLFTKV
ncbi:MAG: hypothetical protein KDD32_11880 [Bacteroidetes bacterium]|nr:hypothetical protein [Bacteroidota bacterium]